MGSLRTGHNLYTKRSCLCLVSGRTSLTNPKRTFKEIGEIVAQYQESPRMQLKEEILELYHTRVRGMANSIPIFNPSVVSSDDLYQVGMLAVLAALETYDPSRKAAFPTYAFRKIQGSMQDLLRRVSSTSRNRNVPMVSLDALEESSLPNYVPPLPDNLSDHLHFILVNMEPLQRSIIVFLINGLNTRAIARLLGRRFSDIQVERAAAVEALQQELERIGFNAPIS